jgi:integrase
MRHPRSWFKWLVRALRALCQRAAAHNASLRLTWEAARDAWLDRIRRGGGSPHTAQAYEIAFRQFFEWAGIPPWQVSSELARAWARHMAERGLADRTINLKLSALSSFYEFVAGRGAPPGHGCQGVLWPAERGNPFKTVERPRVFAYSRTKSPNLQEMRAILGAINTDCLTGARDFALLYTILVTCRRVSEVLGMRWGDIRPLDSGDYVFSYRTRQGPRQSILNHRCYGAICGYLEMDGRPPDAMAAGDYIFTPLDPARTRRLPGNAGKRIEPNRPLSGRVASRIVKKYARRAGVDIEKARIPGLRHAGARLRARLMTRGSRRVTHAQVQELLANRCPPERHHHHEARAESPRDMGSEAAALALMPARANQHRAGTGKRRPER